MTDPRTEAADPATEPARLAELAYQFPETRTLIARHPAAYDGLLDWLHDVGDASTRQVVAVRRAPVAAQPVVAPPARGLTREQREAEANRRIAEFRASRGEVTADAAQQARDAEVAAHAQRFAAWSAAYAQLHPGEPVPPMPDHFSPAPSTVAAPGTNVLAVLALVFGLGGGLLGIILGHAARSQIRRTGERGWGLATAGLIFGYLGLIGSIIAIIVVIAVGASR